jgi:hypothetical protein
MYSSRELFPLMYLYIFGPRLLISIQVLFTKIARDPVKHELTKHIGVDVYYTRAQFHDSVIVLQYVPSEL